MTKAHPHADLMLQYAQDAAETETPWERWEFLSCASSEKWCSCGTHPEWKTLSAYRRKPQIITVNGFEVPAPAKELMEDQVLWAADPTHPEWAFVLAYGCKRPSHALQFKRGVLHTTKEAAVAHAKAMLGIDPRGE